MTTIVPDVSVAAKWVVALAGEELRERAVELLARQRDGEVAFAVPDIFWAELGNLLWKAVRRGRISREDADRAIGEARAQDFASVSSADLLPRAFEIANSYGRTVYDSLYVALAVSLRAEMITADERLANALAAHLPVKWLGAL